MHQQSNGQSEANQALNIQNQPKTAQRKSHAQNPYATREGKLGVIQSKDGQKPPIRTREGQVMGLHNSNSPTKPVQRKIDPFQRVSNPALEAYEQQMAKNYDSSKATQTPVQRQAKNTGLPDHLKAGIENLSGYSMDDVKVHYNSDKPTQLNAHAYAQGTDIHIASGQEKHLPHEAWHVVQQKQGRVKPTMQFKGNVAINDDQGLEKEADVMGEKASKISGLENNKALHTTGNIIDKQVRQLVGEANAYNQANNQMDRGNVQGDVQNTQGWSYAMVQWLRNNTTQTQFFTRIRVELQQVVNALPNLEAVANSVFADKERINAYASEFINAGNCGEFARVVMYHIKENTVGQHIYVVSMETATNMQQNRSSWTDHEFNIITDADNRGEIKNPNAFRGSDRLVDAWGQIPPTTLAEFLTGNNPYNKRMHKRDIKIREHTISDGRQKLNDPNIFVAIRTAILQQFVIDFPTIQANATNIDNRIQAGQQIPGMF